MEITWLSLLPPSIAVISAAITKRINTSLFAGIVAACLIGTSFAPVASAKLLISSVLEKLTDPDNLLGTGRIPAARNPDRLNGRRWPR